MIRKITVGISIAQPTVQECDCSIFRRQSHEAKDDDLFIQFNVYSDLSDRIVQEWQVKCAELVDYSLTLDFIEDINVYNEHVLLWKENQEHYSLFFKGIPRNAREIIGR